MVELSGMFAAGALRDYPAGMRVIARRERPHPGAQLDLIEEADGWRYTCFATDTQHGQYAWLDARHRSHARVEDRIRCGKSTGADTDRRSEADPGRQAALRRAGRQRNLDATIDAVRSALRGEHLQQPPRVEAAMGEHAIALLRAMATAVNNIDRLSEALAEAFDQHPDAVIITSMPGLGPVLGARLLGEIGDDRTRFADARGLKAFAGTAPVTRASGTKRTVTARVVRNKRLGQVGFLWAFSLLTASPGARAHYDRRREHGDRHAAACRNLANRYLGILHHCPQTGTTYDESTAFPATDNQHAATSTAA